MKNPSIGVVFITHFAEKHIPFCLPPILASPLKPKVLVVNSSSGDRTLDLARDMGANTLLIPRKEFNHGLTREKARKHLQTDIIVMMTPDAYAIHSKMLESLVTPLIHGEAVIAYARQIPHEGADFLESFSREFNYPSISQRRNLADVNTYGVHTFFCSNACAAYLSSVLDEVGGFPYTLFGEDTHVTLSALEKGYQIYYAAEAVVRHSHRYTLKQEFKRHFDIALSRKELLLRIKGAGTDTQRGWVFTKELFKQLTQRHPRLLPRACLQTLIKWLGYQLGTVSQYTPLWFKKRCSSQDFFWI